MMDAPFFGFGFLAMITSLIYLSVVIFIVWLVFRYVKAHESISDSLREIAHTMRRNGEEDRPL